MKNIYYLLAATSISIATFTACGSSKPLPQGDVEIIVPCSGPNYSTNNEYVRASAMGLSTDMNIAKKKALSSARSEIATAIEAKVKILTEDYISSYQNGENDESKRRFQEMARTVVNRKLTGVRTICEQTMKSPEGNYKVYVAVELANNELLKDIVKNIQEDKTLRTDFEYEKFKKLFEEEMGKTE